MQPDKQIVPRGYLTLDEAVDKSGYKPNYLVQLAREGNIKRIEKQGISYFSARSLNNYIQPNGYWTIEEAASVTGLNSRYLGRLAREKRVRSVKKRRRTFLLSRDVKNLIVPEGFVTPGQAADIGGYVTEYLIKLSRRGIIRRIVVRGQLYLSLDDIKRYDQNPEGYLSPEEAVRESGYSHASLRRFARKGKIRSTTRHEIVYFFAEDIQGLKVPEGFLSLEEAVIRSDFSVGRIKYQIKTDRIRTVKRHGKRYVSAEDLGIHAEEQKIGTGIKGSIDAVVGESE